MRTDQIFLLVGDTAVYWYGIIIALAIGIGVLVACYAAKLRNINRNHILFTSMVSMPLAWLGGRLYYVSFSNDAFAESSGGNPCVYGGYALYGALIGVLAGAIIAALLLHCKVGNLLDVLAPGLAACIAVGRWANVFSGENMGGIVDSESMQSLPFAVYSTGEEVWRTALFFYESLVSAGICVFLFWLINYSLKHKNFRSISGDVYLIFVITYTLTHGLLEDKRIDPLFFINNLVPKLQTVRVSFALGGLFSAIALSVFLIRRMTREGIKPANVIPCMGCAVCYTAYFCKVIRIGTGNSVLDTLIITVGGIGLIAIGIYNYWQLATQICKRKRSFK
ncbi:MAG: prolipoprotein diacylglyceryl transferase [Clostridia bacterium]|nr:prolipoprotein diacylglyceryl transferase [Clostridia bacterium]